MTDPTLNYDDSTDEAPSPGTRILHLRYGVGVCGATVCDDDGTLRTAVAFGSPIFRIDGTAKRHDRIVRTADCLPLPGREVTRPNYASVR